jgi:hypothetical protein
MRLGFTTVLAGAAAIVAAQAPPSRQVFQFAHTSTEKHAQEIATAIRIAGDIQDVAVDFTAGTLTVGGTPDQLRLTEWILVGLDRTLPIAADAGIHEFRLSEGADNVVRLFYLDRGQTVQEFQEFATMLRTIAEIRRVFTYNDGKTLGLRGTADQMAMADWFANELTKSKPAPRPHSMSPEYLLPADPSPKPNENATQILYVENAATLQDFQQLATVIRTIAEIRRVFTYNTPRAIAVRGIADQIDFATWLFNELDQPPTPPQITFRRRTRMRRLPTPKTRLACSTCRTPQPFRTFKRSPRPSVRP